MFQTQTGGFDADSSPNELGVCVLVGSHFSVVPPADYAYQDDTVRLILDEFGSHYRPVWVTNWWRSPNGGLFRRVHHILGHYDPRATSQKRIIPNLLLPTRPLYGIDWRHPIFADHLLDGLTPGEGEHQGRLMRVDKRPGWRRRIPRYEAIDARVVTQLRESKWRKRNDDAEADARREAARAAQAELADHQLKQGLAGEWRGDKLYRSHRDGHAVFVPGGAA